MSKFFANIPHSGLYKFSFLVFSGAILLYLLVPDILYHQLWIVLVFFFLLTLLSMEIIARMTRRNPKNFLAIYFSVMIGRLFISIIFATIFILLDRSNVFTFAINFLILYLLFLGFEIYGIITNLRHHFKKGTGDEK